MGKKDGTWNVKRLTLAFAALCVGVLAIDAGYHRYVQFSWEGWFGFHGFFGFIAGAVLVLAATVVRRLLRRREDYYDG